MVRPDLGRWDLLILVFVVLVFVAGAVRVEQLGQRTSDRLHEQSVANCNAINETRGASLAGWQLLQRFAEEQPDGRTPKEQERVDAFFAQITSFLMPIECPS